MVVTAGTVAVAVQVVVEVSDLVAMAMVVIHRVLHVIHSGGKSRSSDGWGTLVKYWR